MTNESLTSGIIIIGNEILSGRTDDKNINFLAKELFSLGIKLREVRVVADIKEDIIFAVKEMHNKYDYIFTTGGIGPTHDDITVATISSIFDIPIEKNKGTLDTPYDCKKIFTNPNNIIGFQIKNIFVMAGIPRIMNEGFLSIKPSLKQGKKFHSKEITFYRKESSISSILEKVQDMFHNVEIGSYPFTEAKKIGVNIVLTSTNKEAIEQAHESLNTHLSISDNRQIDSEQNS